MARPTRQVGLYLQCVGRVLRVSPETGKDRALLLDFAGVVLAHGWPTMDRQWTLEGRKRGARVATGEVPVKLCKVCYAAIPAAAGSCPECGHKEPPRAVDGKGGAALVEIEEPVTPDEKLKAQKYKPVWRSGGFSRGRYRRSKWRK